MAQETGWGQHVGDNNPFGISPGGEAATYPSISAGAQAYVGLIKSRYGKAAQAPTADAQAQALQAGGYNPDPTYGTKVAQIAQTVRNAGPYAGLTDAQLDSALLGKPSAPAASSAPSSAALAPAASDAGLDAELLGPLPAPPGPQGVSPTAMNIAAMTNGAISGYSGIGSSGGGAPAPVDLSYQALKNDLAPAPNTTYGEVVPFARNNATGAVRPALPGALRSLARGVVDLAYGPTTGTVTPAATNALMAGMSGLTPSVAADSGAAVAAAEAGGGAPRPNPLAIANDTMRPASKLYPDPMESIMARWRPAIGAGAPTGVATDAAPAADLSRYPADPARYAMPSAGASANPLAAGEATAGTAAPLSIGGGAPLALPAPEAPTAAQAQEAAEYAAIPEKVPPAPKIPPLTQNAADARADQLIRHFAARQGVPASQDLVPGFVQTLSQITNDPGIATLERGVQAAHGGALDIRKAANQQVVNDFTANLVGAPEDIAAAQAERDAVTAPLRDAAFANKTDVDVSPIEEDINKTLAGPEGKRTAVRKTLADVQASLHVGQDPDAPLETDPEQLYGIRKHINDLLSPVAQRDNPELQRAAGNLASIKDQLDGVIEQGAPGFKDYVAQYAGLSRPIDSMQYLQGLDLTDQAGNVRGASVDRAIKSIRKLQRAPGANKAGSITEDTMDQLQRLHRTIQAARYTETAGKTLGSNTFQNLATNSRVGAVAGNPLIHLGMAGAGSLVGGAPGAMLGATLDMAGKGVAGRAESMTRNALVERLLNLNGKGAAALSAAKK